MMTNYPNMTTDELVDLLSHHTQKITHYLAEKEFGPAYDDCKDAIHELQSEIEYRKSLFFNDPATED